MRREGPASRAGVGGKWGWDTEHDRNDVQNAAGMVVAGSRELPDEVLTTAGGGSSMGKTTGMG